VSVLVSTAARAQEPAAPDSTEVVIGGRYAAGGLHRWLFGSHYRDLWTAPITVEVLDLAREGGGLTPVSAGGGFQTPSLWFRGADGYMYGFRGVDKIPDAVLPEELQDTWVESLVQDQISSQHPGGVSVVRELLEAVGIPRTNPRLVVLPDDPRLGEHRARFGGLVGYIERRATIEPGIPPFDDAAEIIDADELYTRVRRSGANKVDVPAFLSARLFDYFIGDWDRHRGQWNFLRHPHDTGSTITWTVLPEDRDQAFAKFDGLMLSLGRQYAPFLLNFDDDLPKAAAFAWNGRDLDRRFLVELEWPAWDSVVTAFIDSLPDPVIDAAVRRLPPEYYALDGQRLAAALKSRRDQLPTRARDYYELLAGEVEVHGTDVDETVIVERGPDGSSTVSVRALGSDGREADPHWRRRFLDDETEELRIFLYGGADRVIVRGPSGGIPVHIVGAGADDVENTSAGGGVHFYTTDPPSTAGRVSVDTRRFMLPPKSRPTSLPPRDWGYEWMPVLWAGFGPDVGLFLGGGAVVTHYGFRKLPYASKTLFRGGFSTGALTGRVDFSADVYRRNSRVRGLFDVRLSGIEVLRFNGLGNDVELSRDDDYYRVRQQLIVADPAVSVPVGRADLALGPTFTYRRTREQDGRILQDTVLYGEDGFGQIGLRGDFELDTRDVAAAARRGVHVVVGGRIFPNMWDVESTFGEVHGHAATYLTASGAPLEPTLALRVGGKKVWGDYPFQEAAFIGDQRSVRLGRQHRYGGDAALWGNAELRLQLVKAFLLLPARFGIFGLGDVGRVYLEGETSSTWHWAAGGGIWIAFLGRPNTLSLALAQSEEKLGVYAAIGFAF
jgi:hypothetical protein